MFLLKSVYQVSMVAVATRKPAWCQPSWPCVNADQTLCVVPSGDITTRVIFLTFLFCVSDGGRVGGLGVMEQMEWTGFGGSERQWPSWVNIALACDETIRSGCVRRLSVHFQYPRFVMIDKLRSSFRTWIRLSDERNMCLVSSLTFCWYFALSFTPSSQQSVSLFVPPSPLTLDLKTVTGVTWEPTVVGHKSLAVVMILFKISRSPNLLHSILVLCIRYIAINPKVAETPKNKIRILELEIAPWSTSLRHPC